MGCLHVSRNGNLIFEYFILDYWLPSQYHMQLLLLQATPNVFQPAAQHYDSQSTFCALIGGRRSQVLKIKMKMMEEAWRRKRWPRRGHYGRPWRLKTPCFCFAKGKLILRFSAVSFSLKPWLTSCQTDPLSIYWWNSLFMKITLLCGLLWWPH